MSLENISPEEKLFRIIQQEKSVTPAGGQDPLASKKQPGNWLKAVKEAVASWKDKLAGIIKNLIRKIHPALPAKEFELELKTINIVLGALLFGLIVFVIYYAVTKYPSGAKVAMGATSAQSSLKASRKDIEELRAAGYYLDNARQRNIFTAAPRAISMGPEVPVQGADKSLSGELKVQGISWSEVPKVMISDKDNKLYVLKAGQPVGTTGIKVKTILKNKVILTYGDREFEL
jgi:hypothetical protein